MVHAARPLHVPEAMCEAYHYDRPSAFSRGFEVALPGARLVFVSGTASVGDKGESLHVGDFGAQARRMFANATRVLESAGATWQDVVKTTLFLRDIGRDYGIFNQARSAFFAAQGLTRYPASTCVEAALCREDLLVEMEVLAVVPEAREDGEGAP